MGHRRTRRGGQAPGNSANDVDLQNAAAENSTRVRVGNPARQNPRESNSRSRLAVSNDVDPLTQKLGYPFPDSHKSESPEWPKLSAVSKIDRFVGKPVSW